MKTIVVDASVVLRSILPTTNPTKVPNELPKLFRQVKTGGTEVVSVPFLMIEIANGLRFHWPEAENAQVSMKKALKLPIRTVPLTGEQIQDALELSYELGATVYDACYHLIARLYNGTFITCDRAYFQKAKAIGNIELWS